MLGWELAGTFSFNVPLGFFFFQLQVKPQGPNVELLRRGKKSWEVFFPQAGLSWGGGSRGVWCPRHLDDKQTSRMGWKIKNGFP